MEWSTQFTFPFFPATIPQLQHLDTNSSTKTDGFGPISSERTTDFTVQFEGLLLALPFVLLLLALPFFPLVGKSARKTAYDALREYRIQREVEAQAKVDYMGGNVKVFPVASKGYSQELRSDSQDGMRKKHVARSKWRKTPLLLLKLISLLASAALALLLTTPFDESVEKSTSIGYAFSAAALILCVWPSVKMHHWTWEPVTTLQLFAYAQTFVLAVSARTTWTIYGSCARSILAIVLTVSVAFYSYLEGIARVSLAEAKANGISRTTISPLLSRLSFHYVQPIFSYGWRQHRAKQEFSEERLWELDYTLCSESVDEAWDRLWNSLPEEKRNIWRMIYRLYFWRLLPSALIATAGNLIPFANPPLLNAFLDYLARAKFGIEGGESSRGWLLALGFGALVILQTCATHASIAFMMPGLIQMRTAIQCAVYKKSFRLSPEEWGKRSVGDLVNHIAVDAEKFIDEWGSHVGTLISIPAQVALGYYLVYQQLGLVPMFAGFGFMVGSLFIMPIFAAGIGKAFTLLMGKSDEMNKIIQESINGIQAIKFNAWEVPMMAKILKLRAEQLKAYPLLANSLSAVITLSNTSTTIALIIVLAVYNSRNGALDPAKVFVSLTALQLAQASFDNLSFLLQWFFAFLAAASRVNNYLKAEELVNPLSNLPEGSLSSEGKEGLAEKLPGFDGAWFSWQKEKEEKDAIKEEKKETEEGAQQNGNGNGFELKDVTLNLEPGELLGVVGRIASGKSSLVSALLGHMYFLDRGTYRLSSQPIGYCPQVPFIISASIQSNITFGLQLDSAILDKVVHACCLETDLAIIPGGLAAEVGERGLNLSGGQKARLGLARVCYAALKGMYKLVILDDVLAAVDADTDQKIFSRVICGPNALLQSQGCTRILITHAAHHYPSFDRCILMKEGSILYEGTHSELLAKPEYVELLAANASVERQEKAQAEAREILKQDPDALESYLTQDESMALGRIGFVTYKTYISYGGPKMLGIAFIFFVASSGAISGGSFWLSEYLNHTDTATHSVSYYLGILGVIDAVAILLSPPAMQFLIRGFIAPAIKKLFETVLPKVFYAPQFIFDTIPSSRMLTRLSNDQKSIDQDLSFLIMGFLILISHIVVTFVSTGISSHGLVFAILPVLVPLYLSIRRLDSGRTRAPLYALSSETFNGISSIQSNKGEERYLCEFHGRVNRNQRAKYMQVAAVGYMFFRLDILSAVITFAGAAFNVLLRDSISLAYAGITMSGLIVISKLLGALALIMTQLETEAVHLERAFEQLRLPSEAPPVMPLDATLPENWPPAGSIEFKGFSARYRPSLPLVLQDISFKIESGQRVAIVGRSGSGKSTLTLSLFRFMEAAEGSILIDGVSIADLGLTKLRSSINIVPQTAMLFGGTIRSNLSPVADRTDDELWAALELAGLKEYVGNLEKKLDEDVQVGGKNFSAGQLQQLACARATLHKAKVLILDEATSNLDRVSDQVVQEVVRNHFKDTTILTIAHRIRTILDYDIIVVLDKGQLVEFGSPKVLLENENGYFHNLAKEAGEI
ncbi:P-loop containing nucleoside triphosphate hydrolase protein [Atractiella rhizophila]|nr:P-loop containing nucleoside triphosphate hydrolase protein [Atractiella rhizophila]